MTRQSPPPARVAGWSLFAVVLTCLSALGGTADQGRDLAVRNILFEYAKGSFDAVVGLPVVSSDDISAVRRAAGVADWPSSTRAAFVLEALHLAIIRTEHGTADRVGTVRSLFASGKALVGGDRTSAEFAGAWHSAALAVLQGPGIARLLARDEVDHPYEGLDPGDVALARARDVEQYAWYDIQFRRVALARGEGPDDIPFGSHLAALLHPGSSKDAVKRAVRLLQNALAFPSSRHEAMLRIGALQIADGDFTSGLSAVDGAIGGGKDPWVLYNAHMFKGRALQALRKMADAKAQFEAALQIMPHAKSANLAMAGLRVHDGVPADPFLRLALTERGEGQDPWKEFDYGGYRFWTQRRDEMRRLIR